MMASLMRPVATASTAAASWTPRRSISLAAATSSSAAVVPIQPSPATSYHHRQTRGEPKQRRQLRVRQHRGATLVPHAGDGDEHEKEKETGAENASGKDSKVRRAEGKEGFP